MDESPKTATQTLMAENRLRCIAQSAVARAMDMERDNVRLDRHHARRDAYEIAINAAAFAIQMLVENDAELSAARAERDHYKRLAIIGLQYTAMPQLQTTLPKDSI